MKLNILVINAGSSSLKYQLIDVDSKVAIAKGVCDRIGINESFLKQTNGDGEPLVIQKQLDNHTDAMELLLDTLVNKDYGVISGISEISAVGHRVVHGGEKFNKSVLIDDKVMAAIKDCSELAPLHNPSNLVGIEVCGRLMPNVPQVAVFDTAFHQTMPEYAYIYAIPYQLYKEHGIRRYGFHGTSHRYVCERYAEIVGKDVSELKLISCHLGNGSSIAAVKYGEVVDTSMGFTPVAGLPMGTRCGDIDPAILLYLMDKENMSMEEVNDCINKKSGMLGVSEVSSDFRDIDKAEENGNANAKLALDIFEYSVKKYIGSYSAVMNGVDGIIFTAGVGENNPAVREGVLAGLDYLGVNFDVDKNNETRGEEVELSTETSKVKVYVIPTNEELEIANQVLELL